MRSKNKLKFPALVFCGLSSLGLFNCISIPENIREPLECKLDIGRKSQTYVFELKKGDFFAGVNPIYDGEKGGFLLEIRNKKGDEFVKAMFEIYEDKSGSDSYAGEMRIDTPDFFLKFNKKYESENKTESKDKIYCRWWHINVKLYNQFFTGVDADGDGNLDRIYNEKNKLIELYSTPKKFKGLSPFEKDKDIIAKVIETFEKSKKYMMDYVGDLESIIF